MTVQRWSRRSLIGGAAVLACLASGARAQSRLDIVDKSGTLRIGWGEFKPFEYQDVITGQLKGILIDAAKNLAERMGKKPEFILDGWPTLPAGIAAGKYDVALMGYSEGRAKVVDFSKPLYTTEFTGMVRKSGGLKSWDQIDQPGNTVAVVTGSSTDEVLARLEQEGKLKVQVQRVRDVGSGILAVSSGNVTAYLNQRDALSLMVAAQPQLALVEGSFGEAWFGVAMPKGDATMREAVDKAVTAMVGDGTVARLIQTYDVKGAVAAR